jgi:hypothetical protein
LVPSACGDLILSFQKSIRIGADASFFLSEEGNWARKANVKKANLSVAFRSKIDYD